MSSTDHRPNEKCADMFISTSRRWAALNRNGFIWTLSLRSELCEAVLACKTVTGMCAKLLNAEKRFLPFIFVQSQLEETVGKKSKRNSLHGFRIASLIPEVWNIITHKTSTNTHAPTQRRSDPDRCAVDLRRLLEMGQIAPFPPCSTTCRKNTFLKVFLRCYYHENAIIVKGI